MTIISIFCDHVLHFIALQTVKIQSCIKINILCYILLFIFGNFLPFKFKYWQFFFMLKNYKINDKVTCFKDFCVMITFYTFTKLHLFKWHMRAFTFNFNRLFHVKSEIDIQNCTSFKSFLNKSFFVVNVF